MRIRTRIVHVEHVYGSKKIEWIPIIEHPDSATLPTFSPSRDNRNYPFR